MNRIGHSCFHAASGFALALGLGLASASPLHAQSPYTPPTAESLQITRGDWSALPVKVTADSSSVPVRQATPKDPRAWAPLIQQAYPREAALAGLEGSVRIRVVVDEQGRVSDCFVIQSSGHGILDQAACDGMRRFAVFNPAVDASGSPTVGSYATIITYKMRTPPPPTPPAISPGQSTTTT